MLKKMDPRVGSRAALARPGRWAAAGCGLAVLIAASPSALSAAPRSFLEPTRHASLPGIIATPNAAVLAGRRGAASLGLNQCSSPLRLCVAIASTALLAASLAARRRNVNGSAAMHACLEPDSASAFLAPAELTFAGATSGASFPTSLGLVPNKPIESLVTRHLLMPSKIIHKKPHKPKIKPHRATNWKHKGRAVKCNSPKYGKYALVACVEMWINSAQIENVRRCFVRVMQRRGKLWIRIFPYAGITERAAESRMGAGKGNIAYWCCPVKPGRVLFEIDGIDYDTARNAMRKATYRFPGKVKMVVSDSPSLFERGLAGLGGLEEKKKRAEEYEQMKKGKQS